ncbi:MAG TPA: hypothetical protein VFZ99_02390 [Terriglobales bacterium]
MKKVFIASILAFATFSVAQDTQTAGQSAGGAQNQTQPGATPGQTSSTPGQSGAATGQAPNQAQPGQTQSSQASQPAQQKVIKDPSEYNAYMAASQQTAPAAKAAAFEQFVQQYPNTVVKEEALEQLMAAYQAAGDQAKMTDAANRVLTVNPNNLRALALLTYTYRTQGQSTGNQQMIQQASQLAQRGLQAEQQPKPAGVPDADWQKLIQGVNNIFSGALGISALQLKDYANAQKYLSEAVQANPNNLLDVYPLAQSYILADPKLTNDQQALNGLWYAARSVALAPTPQAQQEINTFGLYYYKKYHGGPDGWDQLVAQAKSAQNGQPPQGFTITKAPPPPTPSEFADQIMQKYNGDVSQMAYEDWLFILGSGNQKDADAVWAFLKGKLLPITGKVVNATPEELQLATTEDDKQENKADVTVRMTPALRLAPKPGSAANVVGKVDSYVAQPSLMLTLTEGKDKNAKPTRPARRAPARRRRSTR